MHLNDVDEKHETFTKCFLKIAKECIPTKIVTIRNNDRSWFNSEIRKEIRMRDRLRKHVLKFHRKRDINKSHLSSSPYTISSKFSSFIEFLRGGIQLLPLFDLISIFIIFQYIFGLDEFSKEYNLN
jgi:hypothetical protein